MSCGARSTTWSGRSSRAGKNSACSSWSTDWKSSTTSAPSPSCSSRSRTATTTSAPLDLPVSARHQPFEGLRGRAVARLDLDRLAIMLDGFREATEPLEDSAEVHPGVDAGLVARRLGRPLQPGDGLLSPVELD